MLGIRLTAMEAKPMTVVVAAISAGGPTRRSVSSTTSGIDRPGSASS